MVRDRCRGGAVMVMRYVSREKRVGIEIRRLQRSISDVQRPTGTEKARTLEQMQETIDKLALQQTAILATQAEQDARSAHPTSLAAVTISATTPGLFPTVTRAMPFPPPVGGGRVATLSLSAEFVRVEASGNVTVWIEVLQNGVVTWRRTGAFFVGDTASAPAAWGNPSINEPISLFVEDEADASMQIRLYAHVFTSGTVTARMQDIKATLTYGARI